MCQRSAAQVGVDLLDAGVPAVGLLALRAVVMAGAVSASAAAAGGAAGGVEALDAADQQPNGDVLVLCGGW